MKPPLNHMMLHEDDLAEEFEAILGYRTSHDGIVLPGVTAYMPAWAEVATAGRLEKDGAATATAGTGITASVLFRTPSLAATQVICNLRNTGGTSHVFQFTINTAGTVSCPVYDTTGTLIATVVSTPGVISTNTDYWICWGYNSTTGARQVWVNGSNVTSGGAVAATNMNWANGADFGVFAYSNSGSSAMPIGASMSELWVHNQYYDMSNAATRALFYSGDLTDMPDHGADGSASVGVQPLVYFGNRDNAAAWDAGQNRGSLGAFGISTVVLTDRVFF